MNKDLEERGLLELDPDRTFFYPACEVDWSPLFRFTHDCDTFVYVDWSLSRERFQWCLWEHFPNTWTGRGLTVLGHKPLGPDERQFLQTARPFTAERRFARAAAGQRAEPRWWGEQVRLKRTVAGQARPIRLYYLNLEALSAYDLLFASRGRAPRYLCIKRCGGGLGGGWTNFNFWQEPFGRLVEGSGTRPEYLVNEGTHDWPDFPAIWQRAAYWDLPHVHYQDKVRVYRRHDLAQPALPGETAAYSGRRTVELVNGPLGPRAYREGELIVLSDGMRVAQTPPANPYVFLKTQPPAAKRLLGALVPLTLSPRRPMEAILTDLTRIAARHRLGAIRTGGFGFEDEAACLRAWADGRLGDGSPDGLTLRLHAEYPGDFQVLREGLVRG